MIRIINVLSVSCVKDGKIILDNVSFDIEKGSFVSIIGSNGSGKSVLIKILSGLMDYNGYININGYMLDKNNINNIREKLSVVFSDMDNLLLGDTVSEDLVISLENFGLDKEEISKRVKNISKEFEIENILSKETRYLTNSEKEKVFIASSLITNPDVLILDDCMHQLSVKDKEVVFKNILNYKKKKKLTIIMVTHNMEDVMYSDRVMVIDKGSIVMDGSVVSVFKQKERLEKYGIGNSFVIDLSLKLIDNGLISYVYTDMGKLVDKIWK